MKSIDYSSEVKGSQEHEQEMVDISCQYQSLEQLNRRLVRQSFEQQLLNMRRVKSKISELTKSLRELDEKYYLSSPSKENTELWSTIKREEHKLNQALIEQKKYVDQLNGAGDNDLRRPVPLLNATRQEAEHLLNCIAFQKFGSWLSTLGRLTHFSSFSQIARHVCSGQGKQGDKTVLALNKIATENNLSDAQDVCFYKTDSEDEFVVKLNILARKMSAHQQQVQIDRPLLIDLFSCGEKLKVLGQNSHLIDEIETEPLNQCIESGELAGHSPVSMLCSHAAGVHFLAEHPGLIEKINPEVLNSFFEDGSSGFFALCREEAGLHLLMNQRRLMHAIEPEVLNRIVGAGPNGGESVVFRLCQTRLGQGVLRQYPWLIEQFSAETLNHDVFINYRRRQSALTVLCENDEGRALFKDHASLLVPKVDDQKYPLAYGFMRDLIPEPLRMTVSTTGFFSPATSTLNQRSPEAMERRYSF